VKRILLANNKHNLEPNYDPGNGRYHPSGFGTDKPEDINL